MTDLADYAELAARIAALGEEDEITIKADDLAKDLPEVQPFGDMIIDTSYRRFIGWAGPGEDRPFDLMGRSHGFITYIEADPLRRVGLWLLHLLFSGRAWAGLALSHPGSRARWLYVQVNRPAPLRGGLHSEMDLRYTAYEHWPQEVRRHPFADITMAGVERVEPDHRPLFAYGWSAPDYNGTFPAKTADQIIWDLTPEGLCALASLFFDMGHATLGHNEVDMEPPHVGFAATQPRSIAARVWLPGSFGFYAHSLSGITLPPWPEDRPQPG